MGLKKIAIKTLGNFGEEVIARRNSKNTKKCNYESFRFTEIFDQRKFSTLVRNEGHISSKDSPNPSKKYGLRNYMAKMSDEGL